MLVEAKAIDKLFALFDRRLEEKGYLAMGGQIIDATVVEAPRQRNSEDEKRDIKAGKVPEEWKDNPHKLAQKDTDARWTLKRGKKPDPAKPKTVEIAVPVFGYKNHISTDVRHGFIRSFAVSDAAAHDGARLRDLVRQNNTASGVWADTAYRSKKNEVYMAKRGLNSKVHHRRNPGKPLSEMQAKANAARSRIRARIEHVCPSEAAHGRVRQDHRHGQGQVQDRHGQSRLQFSALRLAPRAESARLRRNH